MTVTGCTEPTLIRMSGIRKSFNGVQVLNDVGFEVRAGEIHALAGGNGAGKSTLMKILQGVYQKDAGTIEIQGRPAQLNTYADARRQGIGMVFQEFSLVPTLTVAQNIYLNDEPRSAMLIRDAEMVAGAREILERMQVDLDPCAELASLGTAYWQLTEIAKALRGRARVLIMDEPTASLARKEADRLFELLRNLREQGIGIIYISHRMEEIYEIADRITILRNGSNLLTRPISETTQEEIVRGIAGKAVALTAAGSTGQCGGVLLQVTGVSAQRKLHDVSFEVHAGEVIGVAGLMGSGRTELLEALFGINRITMGSVVLDGRPMSPKSPRDAIAAGVVLIPEDRRRQGLILKHSVQENLVLPDLSAVLRGGLLSAAAERDRAVQLIGSYGIRGAGPNLPVEVLSGGNQQKVVIGKWLGVGPRLLLMDEPTAGVDIGTKSEIIRQVREFARDGGAVLVVSSEYQELIAMSDRYLIMRGGSIIRSLPADAVPDETTLEMWVQGVEQ